MDAIDYHTAEIEKLSKEVNVNIATCGLNILVLFLVKMLILVVVFIFVALQNEFEASPEYGGPHSRWILGWKWKRIELVMLDLGFPIIKYGSFCLI